jgi:hypothetical protein
MYAKPNSGLSKTKVAAHVLKRHEDELAKRQQRQQHDEHKTNVLRIHAATKRKQLDDKVAEAIEMGEW